MGERVAQATSNVRIASGSDDKGNEISKYLCGRFDCGFEVNGISGDLNILKCCHRRRSQRAQLFIISQFWTSRTMSTLYSLPSCSLSPLTPNRPNLSLLAIFESPFPSRARDAKARAMLVLLGILECDVLRGCTSTNGKHCQRRWLGPAKSTLNDLLIGVGKRPSLSVNCFAACPKGHPSSYQAFAPNPTSTLAVLELPLVWQRARATQPTFKCPSSCGPLPLKNFHDHHRLPRLSLASTPMPRLLYSHTLQMSPVLP
ncbi:hypothetical protein L210DRAFT_3565845 [Boletus edulis BED1]|uniref:Uncharacterized protein n=1 Tax=Boletus edulis BED1 TaxID=1328754 RepID=A0AAD4BGC7_BOLED|nr:hypothetical protein L210DRAFT_3565845 [Boletus edulis BED1]